MQHSLQRLRSEMQMLQCVTCLRALHVFHAPERIICITNTLGLVLHVPEHSCTSYRLHAIMHGWQCSLPCTVELMWVLTASSFPGMHILAAARERLYSSRSSRLSTLTCCRSVLLLLCGRQIDRDHALWLRCWRTLHAWQRSSDFAE